MDIEEQVYFLQILSTRYHLLIRLLFIEKRLKFYTSINDESRQLISTYSQMEGRVREVIQLRKSIFENNLRIDGLIGERNEAEYMISRHLNGDNKLLLTGFNTITPTQIQQELLLETESEESLLVLNEKNKLRLAESEWNINKSESFGNIGFFQAEYRSNRGDAFNENLGWQIGFQIPVFNKDNPDLQRRKLDLLEDEIEVKKVEEAVDLNKFEYRNRLKTLLKQYQNVEDELVLLESEFNTEDVAVLLELNDFKTSLNSEKIKLHQEILTIYVYWLSATSRLMGDPLINQLSKEKTLICRPD